MIAVFLSNLGTLHQDSFMTKTLLLLGDSIFDNAIYVESGQSVTEHLRSTLPATWKPVLRAVDGAVIKDVHSQLTTAPDEADQIVLSVGGNDALQVSSVLTASVVTVGEAMLTLNSVLSGFHKRYETLLQSLAELQCPVMTCTIYNAPISENAGTNSAAWTALSLFNDIIQRLTHQHGFQLLELRSVLTKASHFAPVSPIEPSASGGRCIAEAICRACGIHES